jgi:repressor LexA
VRISGDSMLPRFVDQQIVYVKPQQTLAPREIGIFILNGEAYCKQLGGENDIRLMSLNGKYEPIIIRENDDFRVLGKVVG